MVYKKDEDYMEMMAMMDAVGLLKAFPNEDIVTIAPNGKHNFEA